MRISCVIVDMFALSQVRRIFIKDKPPLSLTFDKIKKVYRKGGRVEYYTYLECINIDAYSMKPREVSASDSQET
jgi:hypothetical protein